MVDAPHTGAQAMPTWKTLLAPRRSPSAPPESKVAASTRL